MGVLADAFTVFLPVKRVGVMGDGRTCGYVVALRVTYDVSSKPPATIEWE